MLKESKFQGTACHILKSIWRPIFRVVKMVIQGLLEVHFCAGHQEQEKHLLLKQFMQNWEISILTGLLSAVFDFIIFNFTANNFCSRFGIDKGLAHFINDIRDFDTFISIDKQLNFDFDC